MFIFEKAPFAECHASTVVEHEPGKLLAAWFAGDREGAKNVQIWSSRFDGGYCWGNAFGYLEDGGDATFLKAVGKCLKSGARFALQTGIAAEAILPNLKDRIWYPIGDMLFLISNRYDATAGRFA